MDALTKDPGVLSGETCFRDSRVPVRYLFEYLEAGATLDQFLQDYPTVQRHYALAVLALAQEFLTQRIETGSAA